MVVFCPLCVVHFVVVVKSLGFRIVFKLSRLCSGIKTLKAFRRYHNFYLQKIDLFELSCCCLYMSIYRNLYSKLSTKLNALIRQILRNMSTSTFPWPLTLISGVRKTFKNEKNRIFTRLFEFFPL